MISMPAGKMTLQVFCFECPHHYFLIAFGKGAWAANAAKPPLFFLKR